jgi:hypothetical protein
MTTIKGVRLSDKGSIEHFIECSESMSNDHLKEMRQQAYNLEADPLLAASHGYFIEAEEAITDFERDLLLEKAKQMRTAYLAKKQEIRERFPYNN